MHSLFGSDCHVIIQILMFSTVLPFFSNTNVHEPIANNRQYRIKKSEVEKLHYKVVCDALVTWASHGDGR